MKRIPLLAIFLTLQSMSCKNDDSMVQTHQFEERTSGSLPLAPVHMVVIRNQVGPVIIEGHSIPSEIGWFLNKSVIVGSQPEANQIFSQVLVDLQTSNDTAYVSILFPTGTAYCNCLLSLTVPNYIPCTLSKVSGTTDVLYLQSSFVGENVTTTTIRGHHGNCDLTGTTGNVSVESSMGEGGVCRVTFNSGNIALSIPLGTSAMLTAQTGNGAILCTGLNMTDSVRTHGSLTGKLGAGHGNILLSTGTGNIAITAF